VSRLSRGIHLIMAMVQVGRTDTMTKTSKRRNEESKPVLRRWCNGEPVGNLIMTHAAIRHDDFDALVVSELKLLWEGERCLGRLYPQLRRRPQLRQRFLRELANVQQRTIDLQNVLKAAKRPVRGASCL
jgi:hypothetical protein